MAIKAGETLLGSVSGITKFGAFVDLGHNKTGLVHISEISDEYVKDIHDVISVGDEVKVRVLSVNDNDGKINLSLKKNEIKNPKTEKKFQSSFNHKASLKRSSSKNFDDLMTNFIKESQDRLSTLKKNTEGKRGGRGGRRS